MISHRAQIVRNLVVRAEFGIAPDDTFVAWSPLYHMGAVDRSLGGADAGGTVIVVDGFDPSALAEIVAPRSARLAAAHAGHGRAASPPCCGRAAVQPRGRQGVRRDGRPRAARRDRRDHDAARRALRQHLRRDRDRLPALLVEPHPDRRGARRASPSGRARSARSGWSTPTTATCPTARPGELAMRGPTLFSGYWRAPEVNAQRLSRRLVPHGRRVRAQPRRHARFRRPRQVPDQVGRREHLPGRDRARAARRPAGRRRGRGARRDARWGEVPVAFVARRDATPRRGGAGRAVPRRSSPATSSPRRSTSSPSTAFPRSTSGKIQRHELEKAASKRR